MLGAPLMSANQSRSFHSRDGNAGMRKPQEMRGAEFSMAAMRTLLSKKRNKPGGQTVSYSDIVFHLERHRSRSCR
jgi:hypothetical protein